MLADIIGDEIQDKWLLRQSHERLETRYLQHFWHQNEDEHEFKLNFRTESEYRFEQSDFETTEE